MIFSLKIYYFTLIVNNLIETWLKFNKLKKNILILKNQRTKNKILILKLSDGLYPISCCFKSYLTVCVCVAVKFSISNRFHCKWKFKLMYFTYNIPKELFWGKFFLGSDKLGEMIRKFHKFYGIFISLL